MKKDTYRIEERFIITREELNVVDVPVEGIGFDSSSSERERGKIAFA